MTRDHSNPIQEAMVLEHLRHGPITSLEALRRYGCFRLAARVYNLRADGHEIITNIIRVSNNKRIAEYHLVRTAREKRNA